MGHASETVIKENGHQFNVNWELGQKTGFFLDQRDNRALLQQYAADKTVLNTFAYSGGFSVSALAGGAREVVSVDSSKEAMALCHENIVLNFGETAAHTAETADVFEYLKQNDRLFDCIVLDPPAFAKNARSVPNAARGYKELNMKGLQRMQPGGLLFTFSCSKNIDRVLFRQIVFAAAADTGKKVRVLHQVSQPPDHPINIYHPEGEYLKGLVLYIE
jgi:23S rRNA (cytosine1962-C5)-methyltransferase